MLGSIHPTVTFQVFLLNTGTQQLGMSPPHCDGYKNQLTVSATAFWIKDRGSSVHLTFPELLLAKSDLSKVLDRCQGRAECRIGLRLQ